MDDGHLFGPGIYDKRSSTQWKSTFVPSLVQRIFHQFDPEDHKVPRYHPWRKQALIY